MPFLRHGGAGTPLGPLHVSETGLAVFGAAVAKALVGTLSAVLLAATTSVPAALEGLRRLRAPRRARRDRRRDVALRVRASPARCGRMRAALAARGHRPRHPLQVSATGRLATALFLRSHSRGERVHVAMAARGWRARPPRGGAALRRADALFVPRWPGSRWPRAS